MDFSKALLALKDGKAIRLPHWKTDVFIKMQFPDSTSKMTAPYLYVESVRNGKIRCIPWKETFIELLSEEWEIYNQPSGYYSIECETCVNYNSCQKKKSKCENWHAESCMFS